MLMPVDTPLVALDLVALFAKGLIGSAVAALAWTGPGCFSSPRGSA